MITSYSAEFVGAWIKPPIKDALRAESAKTNKPMSTIVSEALEKHLTEQGHAVKAA